ncbi:hypothetical protein NC651_014073 [Populus alba x Populus x berolinensis]|nr:hypothetical protein NC651_014073 [Populus alba x Populus x berolinensis]
MLTLQPLMISQLLQSILMKYGRDKRQWWSYLRSTCMRVNDPFPYYIGMRAVLACC